MSLVRDPTACLPALAAAVRKEYDDDVLPALALHPLPGVLLPEAVPWHTRLVEIWEVYRTSSNEKRRECARLALVRLDGCGMPDGVERPSRLPEWLAEARRIVGAGSEPARAGEWRVDELKVLAALGDWRPAPRVISPPETLREWVAFWRERRRSRDPILKGIAARVLLNLPEADLRAAFLHPVPPEKRLRDLTAAIPVAAKEAAKNGYNYLHLLDWQPVRGTAWPAAEMAEMARAWLEVTSHNHWRCRRMAWRQLIRWDQTGSLAPCGIDLLPFLVRAVQTEKDEDVLWEMARWRPTAEAFTGTEKPDGLDLLRQLETAWQQHRQSSYLGVRASAWLAGIRLRQAGLATESPESFREACLSAVAQEDASHVLYLLARCSPGAEAPAAFHRKWQQVWQHRLEDTKEYLREIAASALARQALEAGTGDVLRRLALEVWRTGTKAAAVTHRLGSLTSRFHEMRAHLAAGSVPDFEKESVPPAQRQYPRLTLPPGHIADREWKMEN